jgi:hypothetical protein
MERGRSARTTHVAHVTSLPHEPSHRSSHLWKALAILPSTNGTKTPCVTTTGVKKQASLAQRFVVLECLRGCVYRTRLSQGKVNCNITQSTSPCQSAAMSRPDWLQGTYLCTIQSRHEHMHDMAGRDRKGDRVCCEIV